jgi:hypothetical protein
VAIVGAGMAGLALAARLSAPAAGGRFAVTLVDKGRAPGGRCATRRTPAAGSFDHGAGAVQPVGEAFARIVAGRPPVMAGQFRDWACVLAAPGGVAGLQACGVTLRVATAVAAIEAASGDGRWQLRLAPDDAAAAPTGAVADPTADAPRLGPFDAVVVAVPAEQARTLLQPYPPLVQSLQAVTSAPCWTVMAAWAAGLPRPQRLGEPSGDRDPLAVVRPAAAGDDARWVLQASSAWSRTHLEASADAVQQRLLEALAARAGLPLARPSWAAVHRWRYAQVDRPVPLAFGEAPEDALAAIGDAWQGGAPDGAHGIERAWCSAQALADAWGVPR